MNAHVFARNQVTSMLEAGRALVPVLFCKSIIKLSTLVLLAALAAIAMEGVAGLLEYRGSISPETAAWFRLSKDGSLGEWVGYIGLEAAAILALMIGIRMASKLHYCLAGVLQFLVFDDALQLHERAGEVIGGLLNVGPASLPPEAFGELLFLGSAAGVIALLFAWHYWSATDSHRSLFLLASWPLGLLAFAAVFLDLGHAFVPAEKRLLAGLFAMAEDGMEIFAVGLLVIAAAVQWKAVAIWYPARESYTLFGRAWHLPSLPHLGR